MLRIIEPSTDLGEALDAIANVPIDSLDPSTAEALDAAHRAITALGTTSTAMWAVLN